MQSSWTSQRTWTHSSKPSTLIHTKSVANLNLDSYWRSRSPSPSESSSSTATAREYNHQSSEPDEYDSSRTSYDSSASEEYFSSRRSTPTPTSPVSGIFNPNFSYQELGTRNPWRAITRRNISPQLSPMSSPRNIPLPDTSRAPSPITPQYSPPPVADRQESPRRLPPPRRLAISEEASKRPTITSAPEVHPEDILPVQPINARLHLELKHAPRILTKSGWTSKNASWAYQWAIKQPKTALLLWMAGEIQSWSSAQFWDLKDSQIPFEVQDLQQAVKNPEAVVKLQWQVAMPRLPRDGSHVEFGVQDPIPVREYGQLVKSPTSTTTMVKVRYLDDVDNQQYVRRRMEISANKPQDKQSLLQQLRAYNRLEHDNLAKIASSYARGQVVAYITALVPMNLSTYLESIHQPISSTESNQLLNWSLDLCAALTYLHKKNCRHGTIRPSKILVDPDELKISFATFGINLPGRTSTINSNSFTQSYSEDERYIYAAPETISRNVQSISLATDIFSLGCCLLDMISVAVGYDLTQVVEHRSSVSHDLSYHANLPHVQTWLRTLGKHLELDIEIVRSQEQRMGARKLLAVIRFMLLSESGKRKSMRSINDYLQDDTRGPGIMPKQVPAPVSRTSRYSMRRVRGRSLDATTSITRVSSSEVSRREEESPDSDTNYRQDSYYSVDQRYEPASPSDESQAIHMPQPARRNAVTLTPLPLYPDHSSLWDLQNLQSFYGEQAASGHGNRTIQKGEAQFDVYDFGYG